MIVQFIVVQFEIMGSKYHFTRSRIILIQSLFKLLKYELTHKKHSAEFHYEDTDSFVTGGRNESKY